MVRRYVGAGEVCRPQKAAPVVACGAIAQWKGGDNDNDKEGGILVFHWGGGRQDHSRFIVYGVIVLCYIDVKP